MLKHLDKTAKIRWINPYIDQQIYQNNTVLLHYQEYLNNQNRIEVISATQNPIKLEPIDYSQNSSYKCDSSEINQEKDEIKTFLDKKKINIYKNILLGFKRHIQNCRDEQQKRIYEKLTEDEWTFSHIQKRVQQNLKNSRRYSLKMKNIIKSKNLEKIFIHYLQNSDELWLNSSRVKNKESYKDDINVILKAHSSNQLVDNILYYKKLKYQT